MSCAIKRPRPVLLHRYRLLLSLLQMFGGSLPRLDFQKYLLLHELEFAAVRSFHFVPYKFGAFSFQSYADWRNLIERGLLVNHADWKLATQEDFLAGISAKKRRNIKELWLTYGHLKGEDLLRASYRRHPYFAINSELAGKLMSSEELIAIEDSRPTEKIECLFTIGYEGLSIDCYLDKLVRNNIGVLCDIRHNPVSRKYGFSKSTLQRAVEKLGMRYAHLRELGIQSVERRKLVSRKDYENLFARYEESTLRHSNDAVAFASRLLAENGRIALTCFEADVSFCHRGRVAIALSRLTDSPVAITHL